MPAAKSPNLIAEKRLIHGNCLERVSRLRFSKVLFGISCRFVCAGSGRFASAEFVCIRCSRPVKGRLGPIRWRRCAGAHRRGSAPSHRLFGRFPARLKRTQSSQRRRVRCAPPEQRPPRSYKQTHSSMLRQRSLSAFSRRAVSPRHCPAHAFPVD